MIFIFPVDNNEKARKALENLNSFQAEVLRTLYGFDSEENEIAEQTEKLSYRDVAKMFDLTPDMVESVEIGALRELRKKRS